MILRRPHDIAELFRDGRARLGWSQSDLAEKVGVTRQWVSLVENEKTSVEFDLVVAALQALGYVLHVSSKEMEPAHPRRGPHESTSVAEPGHGRSARTSLTRGGEALGTQRTRRSPKRFGRTGEGE